MIILKRSTINTTIVRAYDFEYKRIKGGNNIGAKDRTNNKDIRIDMKDYDAWDVFSAMWRQILTNSGGGNFIEQHLLGIHIRLRFLC